MNNNEQGMVVVYEGSTLCPPIAVQTSKKSRFYGWLFVKHTDGDWISIGKLTEIFEGLKSVNTECQGDDCKNPATVHLCAHCAAKIINT